jgi:hypothetical protein
VFKTRKLKKKVVGYPLPGIGPKNTGKRELGTMGTTVIFKPTAVQKKALSLLKGGAKHILLFGGSRRLMHRYQTNGARNRNSGGIYGIG